MVDDAAIALVLATTGVLSLGLFVQDRRLHCLRMSAFAALLGCAGMLIGARLDFGQAGLATLADLCSTLRPVSVATVRNQAVLAPWTCLGMLFGCNLGLALSWISLDRSSRTSPAWLLRLVACDIGMFAGVVLAEALWPAWIPVAAGVAASTPMLLAMVVGMTAGMWGGGWSAEWTLRRWRHGWDA
jgi:hypothetical protein